mmetsp:Transcript_10106/g.29777  ORF Transcript_10106/g.29777 Transcript_10106/m.29777 type:complete len:84 (+) Transcript_10106:1180-1431(+)
MPEAQPLVENQNSFVSPELRPPNSDCYMHLIAIYIYFECIQRMNAAKIKETDETSKDSSHPNTRLSMNATMSERERKRNCNKC